MNEALNIQALNTELIRIGLDREFVMGQARAALVEDLAGGVDATTVAIISENQSAKADFTSRANGVLAGVAIAQAVLLVATDNQVDFEVFKKDGDFISPGDVIFTVTGNARGILLGERSALNFLGRLSGIATLTNEWVKALSGTSCKVRDTRKTTPGLRIFEKFAVRMGGGTNHRMSLSDVAMIKDNHIVAAGSIDNAFRAVRSKYPNLPIEVEIDSIDQIEAALSAGSNLLLLDNMTPEQCKQAVALIDGRARTEASGGISLESVKAYAQSGVDYIAVGALTHSAKNIDIGVDFHEESRN